LIFFNGGEQKRGTKGGSHCLFSKVGGGVERAAGRPGDVYRQGGG